MFTKYVPVAPAPVKLPFSTELAVINVFDVAPDVMYTPDVIVPTVDDVTVNTIDVAVVHVAVWPLLTVQVVPDPATIYVPAATVPPLSNCPACTVAPELDANVSVVPVIDPLTNVAGVAAGAIYPEKLFVGCVNCVILFETVLVILF